MTHVFNRVFTTVGVLVGLATITPPAFAAPITVSFEGVTPGNGSAGQYNWNTGTANYNGLLYTPNGNGSSSAYHFVTFCIERNQFIGAGSTYTNYTFVNLEHPASPGPYLSATTADAIRSMWAKYRGDLDTGSPADRADKSAAFQYAVWHLVDPSYTPSLGGAVATYYSTFLTTSSWQAGQANLARLFSETQQDQLFELRSGFVVQNGQITANNAQITAVPEPATLVVTALLVPALFLRRRATRTAT